MLQDEVEVQSVCDLSVIEELAGGDIVFLQDAAKTFVQDITVEMRALREAFHAGRSLDFAGIAHKLKSSLGLFGVKEGASIAGSLEHIGRSDEIDLSSAASKVDALSNLGKQAVVEMRAKFQLP